MRVALKINPEKEFEVYGVYWAQSRGSIQRHHYVLEDYPSIPGFSVYVEEQIDIVDPNLDGFQIRKDSYGKDMFVHRAAHTPPDLIYSLVEHDGDEAVEAFFDNLREMGLEALSS